MVSIRITSVKRPQIFFIIFSIPRPLAAGSFIDVETMVADFLAEIEKARSKK